MELSAYVNAQYFYFIFPYIYALSYMCYTISDPLTMTETCVSGYILIRVFLEHKFLMDGLPKYMLLCSEHILHGVYQ